MKEFRDKIREKKTKIAIVGFGYIGICIGSVIAKKGFRLILLPCLKIIYPIPHANMIPKTNPVYEKRSFFIISAIKKITVSSFQSGKIIVTGARSIEQLNAAYNFINNVWLIWVKSIYRPRVKYAIDKGNKELAIKQLNRAIDKLV